MMRTGPVIPEGEPHVTLYGRKGCHLCDVARLQLRALQQTLPRDDSGAVLHKVAQQFEFAPGQLDSGPIH
mgnify:CR=1 FL=1